jgi:aryl-alcohol dehydrogenase-like predicted oxidoreductase
MVDNFFQANGREIDCARIYAGGESENMLGRVLQKYKNGEAREDLSVATKAHPSQPGGLTKIGLQEQVTASLSALQVDHINMLYLHQPDTECTLEETLEGVNDLLQQGLVCIIEPNVPHPSSSFICLLGYLCCWRCICCICR